MKKVTKLAAENDNTTPAWAKNESHEPGYRGFTMFDITEARSMQGSKQRNGWLRFICPLCGERKLYIHSESGGWKCHKCNRKGGEWLFAAFVSGCSPDDEIGILSWLSMNLKNFNTVTGGVRLYPLRRFPGEFSNFQSLLIPADPPIVYQAKIARILKSRLKAAILQNVHFLCVSQKKEWIYMEHEELRARYSDVHEKSIRRAIGDLLESEYLEHKIEDGKNIYRVKNTNIIRKVSNVVF